MAGPDALGHWLVLSSAPLLLLTHPIPWMPFLEGSRIFGSRVLKVAGHFIERRLLPNASPFPSLPSCALPSSLSKPSFICWASSAPQVLERAFSSYYVLKDAQDPKIKSPTHYNSG